jgi:hypothetical protein
VATVDLFQPLAHAGILTSPAAAARFLRATLLCMISFGVGIVSIVTKKEAFQFLKLRNKA